MLHFEMVGELYDAFGDSKRLNPTRSTRPLCVI